MANLTHEEAAVIQEILHKFLDISPGQVNVNNEKVLTLTAKMIEDLWKCDRGIGTVKNFLMPFPPRTGQALATWLLDGLKGALKSEIQSSIFGKHHKICLMRIKSFREHILIAAMLD